MDPKEGKLSSEHEPEFSQIVYRHRDTLVEHVERAFHFHLAGMLPDDEDDPLPQSLSELEESIKGQISEAADRLLDTLEKEVAEAARWPRDDAADPYTRDP
jgi:hypothetical protein